MSWSTMRCAASASVVSGRHGQHARVHQVGELHGPTLDEQEQRVLQVAGSTVCSRRAPSAPEAARWSTESLTAISGAHDDLAVDADRALDDAADGEDARARAG